MRYCDDDFGLQLPKNFGVDSQGVAIQRKHRDSEAMRFIPVNNTNHCGSDE